MKSEDTDTKEKVSPILREEILKAVRFQIRENNPPETKKTYERLLKKYSSEDALKLIGGALFTDILDTEKRGGIQRGTIHKGVKSFRVIHYEALITNS